MIINNIEYDVIGFYNFEDVTDGWGYFFYKTNGQISTKPIQNIVAIKQNMLHLGDIKPIKQGIYSDIMNIETPVNIYYEHENCLLVSDVDYYNLYFWIIYKSDIIEYTYEYNNLEFINNL